MSLRDDAKRLRVRDESISGSLSVPPYATDPGPPSLVVQTTKFTTYPTSAQAYFACIPVTVLGVEIEGGRPSLSPLTSTFLALNLGTAIPPQGTNVVVSFVGNRWVFRYDG